MHEKTYLQYILISMYIAMLGRQPSIGMAELERAFQNVRWFSHDSALVDTPALDIQRLGGTVKAGRVIMELPGSDWRKASMKIVEHYGHEWSSYDGKITLGISAYGFKNTGRDVQRTGLILKSRLKSSSASLRLVPNEQAILNTATSHHNKLGLSANKIELMVIRGHGGNVIVAESTGAQNITAIASRDQGRPKRDAFVGMLPPKLAQIMINLTGPQPERDDEKLPVILDPFCGTGVILQEAMLLGYSVYGTDLSEKMIRYSRDNLNWIQDKERLRSSWYLEEADAMDATWRQPIDAVACEAYLGQPFSAPPSAGKLEQVRGNCDHIISKFLTNVGKQIQPGTPLCVAVPAWNDGHDTFTHLPLIQKLDKLGYRTIQFKNISAKELLYYRPEQVVARELLVIEKM